MLEQADVGRMRCLPTFGCQWVTQPSQSTSTMQHDRCDQRLPILREKKSCAFDIRGSLIMCPAMCVYFILGVLFSVYVYRISEVLSSWRLGTKVKHAVNNVDSALNFVTGNFFNKKFQPRRLHPAWSTTMLTKNTGHQKQNLKLQNS